MVSGSKRGNASAKRVAISKLVMGLVRNYEAVLPPFTLMIWPVMNDALREATNTMASAISAGVPARFRGTPATSPAFLSAAPLGPAPSSRLLGFARAPLHRVHDTPPLPP